MARNSKGDKKGGGGSGKKNHSNSNDNSKAHPDSDDFEQKQLRLWHNFVGLDKNIKQIANEQANNIINEKLGLRHQSYKLQNSNSINAPENSHNKHPQQKHKKSKILRNNTNLYQAALEQISIDSGVVNNNSINHTHQNDSLDNFDYGIIKNDILNKSSRVSHLIAKKDWNKIKAGEYKFQAKLDLHGFNKAEAHQQVINFIRNCYHSKIRVALIITGKATDKDPYIDENSSHSLPLHLEHRTIREILPIWLEMQPVSDMMVGHDYAPKRMGGIGARIVLIKNH